MSGLLTPQAKNAARGQLTLEALLLLALALSLLIIAALAISRLQAGQAGLFARRTMQTELEGIGQYVDEICVLGEGNARTMELSALGINLSTDASGRTLVVQEGAWTAQRAVLCAATVDSSASLEGTAYLWYQARADGSPGVEISGAAHP